jgi:hypothetical protein
MKIIHALAVAAALLRAPLARAANDTFSVNGLPFYTAVPGGYLPAVAAYFPNGLGSPAAPLSVAGTALTPVVSAAAESSHVLKASAGNLLSLTVSSSLSGGWLMIFDATSAPADGTVTPKYVWQISGQSASVAWPNPAAFATGIVVVFSSTGPFTKTTSSTAFFSGQVQ